MAERMVYIGHVGQGPLAFRIGQEVTIVPRDLMLLCPQHGELKCVDVVEYPAPHNYGWCPHAFRKPLNFKKLCNVQESNKEPQDA